MGTPLTPWPRLRQDALDEGLLEAVGGGHVVLAARKPDVATANRLQQALIEGILP